MEKKQIIELMQLALSNSQCDVNGDWMDEQEKSDAMSDVMMLTQAISFMEQVKSFQA